MKKIIALCILAFSFSTLACTDFSGKYLDTSMNVQYEVTQVACSAISFVGASPWSLSTSLDGKKILLEKNDQGSTYASAQMLPNGKLQLVYFMESLNQEPSKYDISFEVTKLKNGNLNLLMTVLTAGQAESTNILFEKL